MNPFDLFPGLEEMQMIVLLMGALAVAGSSIATIATHVLSQIESTVQALIILYVIFYGILLMNGAVKDNLHDLSIRVFKFGFVYWFIFTADDYVGYAINYVWTLPEELISFLLPPTFITTITDFATLGFGSTSTNIDLAAGLVATVLSSVLSVMSDTLEASEAAGGTASLTAVGAGLGIVATALSAVTLGALLVAKVSLAILLALGPIFIPAILFEKTKYLFEGWLAQIINYTLVLLLMSLAIYILFPVLLVILATYYALSLAVGLTIKDSVQLIALLGIFVAIMRQVPSTAASISKGYAVSTPDSTGAANVGEKSRQAGHS